ncbi:MAG: hypothetical protein A2029_02390 [Chloroflexi bacterium RBG_19FT_COMBO_47_9]|nr:MAG: hypothetical protein A2029_02390 [Chloroflexi bacterium RBG_19FT_COMBO_47_9]
MCNQHSKEDGCRCRVERIPNFIQPRMLLKLAKKPAHGYELIELLGQESGSPPDPGNFYRLLRSMEEEELVRSNWETQNAGPARRVYELTDLGVDFLHTWAAVIQQTQKSLDRFLSEYKTLFPE